MKESVNTTQRAETCSECNDTFTIKVKVQIQCVLTDSFIILVILDTHGDDWAYNTSSARRYSPGWALASMTISLHWSLFLAFSVQPLIPIFLRSSVTSSVHLNLGLPILLFAYSFPFSTLLGMAISSILSTWPSHCILCVFINLCPFLP